MWGAKLQVRPMPSPSMLKVLNLPPSITAEYLQEEVLSHGMRNDVSMPWQPDVSGQDVHDHDEDIHCFCNVWPDVGAKAGVSMLDCQTSGIL